MKRSFSTISPELSRFSSDHAPFVIRPYSPERDLQHVQRIWFESGWIKTEEGAALQAQFLAGCLGLVAVLDGSAEGMAAVAPGRVRYIDKDLSLAAITAVNTSRIARKRGLGGILTARLIASSALQGDDVAALGVFEQGFYDRLGFGRGSYEHWVELDPSDLPPRPAPRVPVRINPSDWREVFNALVARQRKHGGIVIDAPGMIRAEMGWTSGGFGLGYRDGPNGTLSHFVWIADDGEVGPYTVNFMAFRDRYEYRELLALLRTLGDQVRLVRLKEPSGVQLQDLIRKPFRNSLTDPDPRFKSPVHALSYWQIRILNLDSCLNAVPETRGDVTFQLVLEDTIGRYLPSDSPWRGIGGSYVIHLGKSKGIARENGLDLPALHASAGAFSRMWFGVQPASGLAVTDKLSGPDELLEQLDEIFRLPPPCPDWDF